MKPPTRRPRPTSAAPLCAASCLHRLFERLPDVAPHERAQRADAWLERSGDAPDPDFRRQLIADACRVIGDRVFADLFRPEALAEAPVAAVLPGGQVVAGTVDPAARDAGSHSRRGLQDRPRGPGQCERSARVTPQANGGLPGGALGHFP
jgi:hypothetical protein